VASFARSFASERSFHELLEILREATALEWRERDSAWYDLLAHARKDGARLTLMASGMNEVGMRVDAGNGAPYSLSIDCADEDEARWCATLERELLPALAATAVKPTDPFGD
jgi:hypothetical protein